MGFLHPCYHVSIMHELAITENILQIALTHAEQANARRVTDLNLVIGDLSSVVDDSVQFYWDIISKETVCAGAKLHFERIPAELYCLDCKQTYQLHGELSDCIHCHSTYVQIVHGEEFRLDSISIEE